MHACVLHIYTHACSCIAWTACPPHTLQNKLNCIAETVYVRGICACIDRSICMYMNMRYIASLRVSVRLNIHIHISHACIYIPERAALDARVCLFVNFLPMHSHSSINVGWLPIFWPSAHTYTSLSWNSTHINAYIPYVSIYTCVQLSVCKVSMSMCL